MGRLSQGSLPATVKRATSATRLRQRKNATIVKRRRIGYDALKSKKARKSKPAIEGVTRRRPHGFYDVLQLKPPTTIAAVKKAYRQLAKQLHPDKHVRSTPQARSRATVQFRAVQEAYAVLSDSEKKSAYDKTLGVEKLSGKLSERRKLPSAVAVQAFRRKQSVNDKAEDAAVCKLREQLASGGGPNMSELRKTLPEADRWLPPEFGSDVYYAEKKASGWSLNIGKWTRQNGAKAVRIVERSPKTLSGYRRLRSVLVAVKADWMIGVR